MWPSGLARTVDDNGQLDIADSLALLLFLSGLGAVPPEPFPEVGEDLTPDLLPCG